MVKSKNTRVRKSPEERRREIMDAAVRLVGEKGYYGTSLKEIADAVGMSQPGLLHYIGTKEGLLSMLITDNYDVYGTPEDFMKSGLPGSDPEAPLFPAYLRYLVRYNAQRRELVRLYMVLGSEAYSPEHPLHEYFENRPAAEAMDGIQVRWLRNPPVDLYDEWLVFERMIFPSPLWDNYR